MAVNQAAFAAAVLHGIGAPVTDRNVAGFIGWSKAEGGDNWTRYNPLNTTEGIGAVRTINSAGVRAYANPAAGIRATVVTLKNGNYPGIVNAFRQNNPLGMPSNELNTWGTGSLAYQTIKQTLGQKFNLGAGIKAMQPGGLAPGPTRGNVRVTSEFPVTRQSFNQAGYQQALQKSIAGSYVESALNPSHNPFAGPRTGLETSLDSQNPLLTSGMLTTTAPDPANYMQAKTALQKMVGNVPISLHPAGTGSGMVKGFSGARYRNPLPGSSFTRTDQGVDGTGRTFLTPADSRIVAADRSNAGWKGGGYIAGVILNGPDKGKVWYLAEGVAPTVRVGETIRAGSRIAAPVSNPYNGISGNYEWGWANPKSIGQPLARVTGGYSEGEQTGAGKQARAFLNQLGAGAGPNHS